MSAKMKRAPERFPVDLPVRYRTADSNHQWETAKMLNLSEGGVCLQTTDELVPGEQIEIVVESTDQKGMTHRRLLKAKVVWRKEGRVGLQFLKSMKSPAPRGQKKPSKPKLVVARGKASNKG